MSAVPSKFMNIGQVASVALTLVLSSCRRGPRLPDRELVGRRVPADPVLCGDVVALIPVADLRLARGRAPGADDEIDRPALIAGGGEEHCPVGRQRARPIGQIVVVAREIEGLVRGRLRIVGGRGRDPGVGADALEIVRKQLAPDGHAAPRGGASLGSTTINSRSFLRRRPSRYLAPGMVGADPCPVRAMLGACRSVSLKPSSRGEEQCLS